MPIGLGGGEEKKRKKKFIPHPHLIGYILRTYGMSVKKNNKTSHAEN